MLVPPDAVARILLSLCVTVCECANWTLSLTETTVLVLEGEEVTGGLAETAR